MASDERHAYDPAAMARVFPPDLAVPALLDAWGGWLDGRPVDAFGDLYFAPGQAYGFDDPATVDRAIKFLDGDNVEIFFWRAPGLDGTADVLPVVVLTSEGETTTVPDLAAFIARFAMGEIGGEVDSMATFLPAIVNFELDREGWTEADYDWAGEDREAELAKLPPDGRGEMGAWLLAETGAASLDALARPSAAAPDFGAWMEGQTERREAMLADSPDLRAIEGLMTEDHALILWVGDTYRAVIGTNGTYGAPYRELPEAEALKPHVGALREAWAREKPGMGLWTSAILTHRRFHGNMLTVAAMLDDRTVLRKAWDALTGRQPEWVEEALSSMPPVTFAPHYDAIYPGDMEQAFPIPPAAFAADQARFPRAPHLQSPWLREKLGAAAD